MRKQTIRAFHQINRQKVNRISDLWDKHDHEKIHLDQWVDVKYFNSNSRRTSRLYSSKNSVYLFIPKSPFNMYAKDIIFHHKIKDNTSAKFHKIKKWSHFLSTQLLLSLYQTKTTYNLLQIIFTQLFITHNNQAALAQRMWQWHMKKI